MYEHDYEECANEEQFTGELLQEGLRQLITCLLYTSDAADE